MWIYKYKMNLLTFMVGEVVGSFEGLAVGWFVGYKRNMFELEIYKRKKSTQNILLTLFVGEWEGVDEGPDVGLLVGYESLVTWDTLI